MKRIFSVCVFVSFTLFSTLLCAQTRPAGWNNIEHVVLIIFENERASDTLKQSYFNSLSKSWGYLSNYFAITHPSQPNYIALAAASTLGVTGNRNITLNAKHIGNLFEEKGKTWKAYAENYPGNCYTGTRSGLYYRKHEPFLSFKNVTSDPEACSKVVNSKQFFTDLANNNLPTFSMYTPNMDNDGHDTSVGYADKWLSRTFGSILKNSTILQNTLFILTFDEDDNNGKNNVYAVFIGAGVKPQSSSSTKYNHYDLLKTLESIFDLDSLGRNDAKGSVITNIWN